MADETQAAEDPDSEALVRGGDPASLARWSAALGLTTEALEAAILAVGPRVDRIKDYLTGGMAGDQEDA
jgi:hypothetical protein